MDLENLIHLDYEVLLSSFRVTTSPRDISDYKDTLENLKTAHGFQILSLARSLGGSFRSSHVLYH